MPKLNFLKLLPSACNLWLKVFQSKITNYAKRTQFFKKSNVYNLNKNNKLQQKMDNGHLVKTNPNEPNFTPCWVRGYTGTGASDVRFRLRI
jgi:hypothetical protein